MSRRSVVDVHRTFKPVVAGIVNIVIGTLYLIGTLIIGFGLMSFLLCGTNMFSFNTGIGVLALFVILPLTVLGVLSIAGGILILKGSVGVGLWSVL